MNTRRIEWDFSHHAPDDVEIKLHQHIRDTIAQAAHHVNDLIPGDSREKSLAITKLEEAMLWANAAIARNE